MNLIHYHNTQQLINPAVITIGSFDGVHLGHQSLLQQLKTYSKENNLSSVVITFNPHPQEVLNNKPDFFLINSFEQKITIFERLEIDTVVVIPFSKEFSQKTPAAFFEEFIFSKINVKAIFIGPNHHFGKQREGDANTLISLCKERNIKLIMAQGLKIDDVEVRSTLIRKYLKQKDYRNAELLMGHGINHFFSSFALSKNNDGY